MKNRIKDILSSKKMICMVTICAVVFCALIVTIFLTAQKQDKSGKETEIAGEEKTEKETSSSTKEKTSSVKKKEVGPWADYNAFIEDVRAWLEDDSMAVTTKDLDVSPTLGVLKVKDTAYVPGYYMTDLDSDGIDELMFGYRDIGSGECGILDIYTMKDGLVSHVAGIESMTSIDDLHHKQFSLCENGTIEQVNYSENKYEDGYIWDGYMAYYAFQDGALQLVEAFVEEFVGRQDTKWYYSTEDITSKGAKEISLEEAREMWSRDGYAYRDILFTPFVDVYKVPEDEEDESLSFADYEDNDNLTYADLTGKEFWFYSGAGGWNTTLTINADGTFTGCYQDYDVEHIYECNFSGRFSDLTKTGPYEYTMKCESLKMKQKPGKTETRGEYFVEYTEPYGFDDADEFKVYLPGKKWSELPGGFLSWAHGEAASGYLACYGIYNVGGKQGFMEMDLQYEDSYDYGE